MKFVEVKPKIVRFAPSPTGNLHIGGARTAIFNHLIAQQSMQNKLILRIDDTDFERSTKEYEEAVLDDLKWLGIDWSETVRQSNRFAIYFSYVRQLLEEGKAFVCTCSEADVSLRRKEAKEKNENYRHRCPCRKAAYHAGITDDWMSTGKAVIRFKNPDEPVSFVDLVRGQIDFPSDTTDDFVLIRSDRTPTYHLSSVVDDIEMKITHVIRADDHTNNTAKHILLCKALGKEPPVYAHLSLIVDENGKKLKKRSESKDCTVRYYRDKGYLPEVMINYLCLLGWSHPGETPIFYLNEAVEYFSLESVVKSAATFDEQKLLWMQEEYIRNRTTPKELQFMAEEAGVFEMRIIRNIPEWKKKFIEVFQERISFVEDLRSEIDKIFLYDFQRSEPLPEIFENKEVSQPMAKILLEEISELVQRKEKIFPNKNDIINWENRLKKDMGIKGKELFKPMRAILTGSSNGPALKEYLPLIPFEVMFARLLLVSEEYSG